MQQNDGEAWCQSGPKLIFQMLQDYCLLGNFSFPQQITRRMLKLVLSGIPYKSVNMYVDGITSLQICITMCPKDQQHMENESLRPDSFHGGNLVALVSYRF